jgi:outer membrane receptor protein involved in Fe transport
LQLLNRYIFVFLVWSFPVIFFSQHSVNGVVNEKSLPIEFANVFLYTQTDTVKPLKITVSDSVGSFSFTNISAGEYLVKVQLLGYNSATSAFKLEANSDTMKLAPIEIQPAVKMLDGVEIVSQRDVIKKTTQGFIINAKDNITQAAGTATDLLRNTPTVVVDGDGNITIRGKTPLILVNGRNSVLGTTDRIPASSVESIEIINNPSARYDADADGGIISIKLKKNAEKGTNGSVALGGGYGAKGRVNSAFIINHQTGKWNFGLSYDNRFANRTRKAEANRTNFNLPDEYYLIQNRHDDRLETTQNAKLNIDFDGDKNTFSFEAIGNLGTEDNLETLVSQFQDQARNFQTKNSRFSSEHAREKIMEYALNYSRKFKNEQKSFTMELSTSFDFDTENTDITTQSLGADDSNIGTPFLQRTHNYQNSDVNNFRIDYANPVGKKGIIETGYKGIYRFTNADFQSQYNINNTYIADPLASNIFHFNEQIHAGYLQYKNYSDKKDSSKWKCDIGIRVEQVFNEGYTVSNSAAVKRDYFNFYPTGNLAYYIKPSDYLKLSFSRRINRPDLEDLNPFSDITDSLAQHSGNLYLKPELVNSIEAGYNKEWKKVSMSTILFYRYTTNIIRSYIVLYPNGVTHTQPMNFGNGTTYGFEGLLTTYPAKFWNFNASFSVYQQLIDGSNVSPDLANNVLSYYGKLINNFSLWKGSKLQLIGNYNSPIATPQGTRVAVYFADLGFQQKIMKGRGALGLVFTDIFNTQKNGQTASAPDFLYQRKFKIDTRAVLLTFALSFKASFKEELLENKFSND